MRSFGGDALGRRAFSLPYKDPERRRAYGREWIKRKHKLTEDEYRDRRWQEGLYVRPRVLPRRLWIGETSGSFSASAMSREG